MRLKPKPLAILVSAVVLLFAVIILMSGDEETQVAPTPAADAGVQAQAIPQNEESGYSAECLIAGGSMLMGSVVDNDGKDPAALEEITLRNNNTGKTTDIDMSTARCSFTKL